SGCQAALVRAERQKQLLAAAAKAEFPAVRFQPPPAGEIVHGEEAPARRIRLPRRAWLGWAVAASILLISLGVPATIWSWRYSVAQQDAQALALQYQALNAQAIKLRNEYHATLTQKRQDLLEVQDRIRKLGEGQKQKWEALQKAARERQL